MCYILLEIRNNGNRLRINDIPIVDFKRKYLRKIHAVAIFKRSVSQFKFTLLSFQILDEESKNESPFALSLKTFGIAAFHS